MWKRVAKALQNETDLEDLFFDSTLVNKGARLG